MYLATTAGSAGVDTFFDSSIGEFVLGVLQFFGWAILMAGLFTAGKAAFSGQVGKMIKIILLTGTFAAILIQPQMIVQLSEFLGTLVGDFIALVEDLG